jgi:hypothetical protein
MGKYVTRIRVRVQSSSRLSAIDGSDNPGARAAAARALAIAVLALSVLAACAPGGTISDSAQVAALSPEPYATCTPFPYAPVSFEGLQPYPTPEGFDALRGHLPAQVLPDGVTPVTPTSETSRGSGAEYPYHLVEQTPLGRYAVRVWQSTLTGWRILTITDADNVLVQLEAMRVWVEHAGRDITGEGNPDVVVTLLHGAGSYNSLSTQVFDLGLELTQVLDTPAVATDSSYGISCPEGGVFSDLEGDGVPEFITCDDAPRWGFYGASNINPYAEHRRLVVTAVMEYEPGQGYVPAGHRFPQVYAANIASYAREAEEKVALDTAGVSDTSPDALVALAFNCLYGGRPEKAWAEIERLHQGPDRVLLWSEIVKQAGGSPFYSAEGTLPDVPVPEYYTLRLWPDVESYLRCTSTPEAGQPTCEPVDWLADRFLLDLYLPVAVLEQGQDPDDADVAFRSLAWLDEQLRRTGVTGQGESLRVSSLDCTDKCRLDLVEVGDAEHNTPLGFIELEAAGGFPGEVVRLDSQGVEVGRWRLRGDLTWEQLAP